ncbi:hypothetical protein [Natronolimnohabitans innermongolicus]|nr:hypothetical protein [Natronolimnohabitans innermongolicus]
MTTDSDVALVSTQRVLLTVFVAVLLLAFNYGSTFETPTGVASAAVAYLVVGYLTLTVMDVLFDRLF